MTETGGRVGEGRVRTVRLPWDPKSVPQMRRALRADLEARSITEQVISESEMVVSELVANSIRHARPLPDGSVRVHWKVKGNQVEVEVTDGGGASTPQPLPRATWVSAGRGLRIVRSLAHEWGVNDGEGTRTVWAAMGGPSRRRV
ncbi:ATP-binding protein [Segeticoccus rhizosphaerae]|jgi:anti-sigma regulatory factor (Ser/Thr protein kinase)|uniref:ATP-binding protein n=1 Tax=Segeticoccus rhizosphaerae TaxID=1104777 RepID=UPI0010C046F5|nr:MULTISPECIES: ATP-binding protein [Intrasporangiaceae]